MAIQGKQSQDSDELNVPGLELMLPVSTVFNTVETVRLLLNSIGNKSPIPENKMSFKGVSLVHPRNRRPFTCLVFQDK